MKYFAFSLCVFVAVIWASPSYAQATQFDITPKQEEMLHHRIMNEWIDGWVLCFYNFCFVLVGIEILLHFTFTFLVAYLSLLAMTLTSDEV